MILGTEIVFGYLILPGAEGGNLLFDRINDRVRICFQMG